MKSATDRAQPPPRVGRAQDESPGSRRSCCRYRPWHQAYGAFIDIGGVSGLLHISEISHEHIETLHSVLNVNDQMKVMIIDLDAERGRISLSTKALEPEPGDMLTDPQKVFDKAEEMAARYKQMLLEQAEEGEESLGSMMI